MRSFFIFAFLLVSASWCAKANEIRKLELNRAPMNEDLLDPRQSMIWLLGHRLYKSIEQEVGDCRIAGVSGRDYGAEQSMELDRVGHLNPYIIFYLVILVEKKNGEKIEFIVHSGMNSNADAHINEAFFQFGGFFKFDLQPGYISFDFSPRTDSLERLTIENPQDRIDLDCVKTEYIP